MENNFTKRLVVFNGITLLLGVILFFAHSAVLKSLEFELPFSLASIYLFFVVSAVLIITGIEFLFKYLPASTGYAFLVGVFLKMGLFIIIFFSQGMGKANLTMTDKLSLLIPLFTFMSVETISVVSRLKDSFSLGKVDKSEENQ